MKNTFKFTVTAVAIMAFAGSLASCSKQPTVQQNQSKPVSTPVKTSPTSTDTTTESKAPKSDAVKQNKTSKPQASKDNTEDALFTKSQFNAIIAEGVSEKALKTGIKAYQWAVKRGKVKDKNYLTIVDFSLPSNKKRLFVIDIKTAKVVMKEYTSQGSGSGRGTMATSFSDKDGSHKSVLGAMVTTNTYVGKHGKSLRLSGLQDTNKNVMNRDIVVHPAPYATPEFVAQNGRTGNSWGCFAVNPATSKQLIDTIKGGTVLFAYSPDLSNSDVSYA